MSTTESAGESRQKTISLSSELHERVRAFRHRHQFDWERHAIIALIEKGLDADEATERRKRE